MSILLRVGVQGLWAVCCLLLRTKFRKLGLFLVSGGKTWRHLLLRVRREEVNPNSFRCILEMDRVAAETLCSV